MTRPLTLAAVLFAAAAVLVASSPPATPQPYSVAAPAAVQVPYYGAVYGQPGALTKADVARIIELLESIERNTAPAAKLAAKAGPDKLVTAKARCAGCHTPAKADAKGGGFLLFNDDSAKSLRVLDGRQKAAVRRAVEEGTMPPAPAAKLTPAERSALTSP